MGENNKENPKQEFFEHLEDDYITMDDGGGNADTNRGRSRQPRAASSSSRTRAKSKDTRREGAKEDGQPTPKKRGRPPKKSTSPSKVTPKRTASKQRRQKEDKTAPEKDKTVDLTGPSGRAVKQEIMETSSKIQQTLGFPLKNEVIDLENDEPASKDNPFMIEDDKDTSSISSTSTPKRKRAEMTQGISKVPDGTPKRRTRLDAHQRKESGRGRGGGRGHARPILSEPPARITMSSRELDLSPRKETEKEANDGEKLNDTSTDADTPTQKGGQDRSKNTTPNAKGGQNRSKNTIPNTRNERSTPVAATPRRVTNPYKVKNTPENKQGTKAEARVTYASVTKSPQTKIRTHEKVKEAHESYFEVTFDANEMSKNPEMDEIVANHRAQIQSILMRAKAIDIRAKINTWHEKVNLPTIVKAADIPHGPGSLSAYLYKKGSQISKGKNRNWKIKITTHISKQEFVHHWGLSKRDYTKHPFVTLRSAPLQAPVYHAAGYFLNSSDGQLTEKLEETLSKITGHTIGLDYRPAAIVGRASRAFWTAANKARKEAMDYEKDRAFFKSAPMAMQVYAATREAALQVAHKLSQEYGHIEGDRMYSRLPDGTRMRFIPAHVFLDMQGSSTAARLFQQQIQFQKNEVTAPIPIRDPFQRFQEHGNKTMHELVMDLQDPEQKNEPYFRNMRKKFHWNYKTQEWEVSIHGGMYQSAAKVLRRFKEYMTEQYGETVGEAILEHEIEEGRNEYGSQSGATSTGISISTEDRYMNGDGQFLILGMEKIIKDGEEQTLQEIRNGGDEENTINLKSTTSGLSGNTGNTVPSIRGMDDSSIATRAWDHRENGMSKDTGDTVSSTQGDEATNMDIKIGERGKRWSGIGKNKRDVQILSTGAKLGRNSGNEGNDDDPWGPKAMEYDRGPKPMEYEISDEEDSNQEKWETVGPKKGAKPRRATMLETTLSYAASLSGLMRGSDP